MFVDVLFVIDEFVSQEFLEVRAYALQSGHAIDYIAGEMKTVDLVQSRSYRKGSLSFPPLYIRGHAYCRDCAAGR